MVAVRHIRQHCELDNSSSRRILLKKPAERTSAATGLSLRPVSRICATGALERAGPDGVPERRKSRRRVPPEEYTRVRAAVYQQYL